MAQDEVEQELRPWAGEALWEGRPAASRSVEVAADGAGRYQARGQVGQAPAFAVAIREAQLPRFHRQMERDGAAWHGPPWATPDQQPPFKWGDVGDQSDEKPPPTRPTVTPPDGSPLLLLADAERRRPVLPGDGLGVGAVARVPGLGAPLPRPEHYGDPGGNPNDLSRQRWGVIAPRGPAGDAWLEAVRPLVDLRAEQQGAPVRTYRVAPGGGIAEANEWVRTVYLDDQVPETERPRYLLILGDLGDVSAELQQRLSVGAAVGRLCFDDPAGYRAYAEKAVRQEKSPPGRDARALFFTAHDGTMATSTGYDFLVTPALEICDAVPRRDYPVREVLEVGSPEDWSARRLLDAVRDSGPSVLFTLSHGVAAPRGWPAARRRQLQGAMSLGDQEPLTAEHVARGPFLPGGAWFFLACLSAGTPSRSAYRPWLERLKEGGEYAGRLEDVLAALPASGEPPFIAALPRAALANPEGPLAVVGHLDLAWTYAFRDPYGARRPARFVEVVKQLWTGRRAGVAARALLRYASEAEGELLGMAQLDAELPVGARPPPEAVHRGHLWMARHDLAGYVLLGDPAVRAAPSRD